MEDDTPPGEPACSCDRINTIRLNRDLANLRRHLDHTTTQEPPR
ncbi:hypothetical protein OH791_33780 [Streptomyces anulatus]|nr:hypothetical protein OH791_33780 [Streptomyces anulatus]